MKNILLLASLILLCIKANAQTITYPTMREVYDYAVGDSFVYKEYGAPNNSKTILSRTNYGNDSIIYTERQLQLGNVNAQPYIYNFTITNLDKPYFDQGHGFEAINYVTIANDTFFTLTTGGNCGVPDITFTTYYNIYHRGLGVVDYGFYGAGSNDHGLVYCDVDVCLIYAHKANGNSYGNSTDCYYTGPTYQDTSHTAIDTVIAAISKIGEADITLYPNPATEAFQLKLSGLPYTATTLHLYNVMGELIKEDKITAINTAINRGNMASGLYLWQLVAGEKVLKRGKIMLQ